MDSDVTISQCVVLLVTTLLSGLFATLVTLIWQDKAANKKLKYDIFVALMSNRFRLDSEKVVCALNMIDVVFNTDSMRNFVMSQTSQRMGKDTWKINSSSC